jgi:hypothetical protein
MMARRFLHCVLYVFLLHLCLTPRIACPAPHRHPHHSLPVLLVPLRSTISSPMLCSCSLIIPICYQVLFRVPLCDFCRFHNVCIPFPSPPPLPLPPLPTHLPQPRNAVPLKAAEVSFLIHVFPLFYSPPLPSLHFVILMAQPPLCPLVRDVEASLCTAAFVVAFASALRHATPAAVFQSDSASGTGLVFVASSAACAAAAAA